MVRKKAVSSKPKPSRAAEDSENRRPSNAERSAYFARREAAKVLQRVLQGDAQRRAVASIKSLVYNPSVRNKRATFALVCQTLKHLPIIKDVLESAAILNSKWKKQVELVYIIAYDILFGQNLQEISLVGGDAEKFLIHRRNALQSALAKLLVRKKVKNLDDLIALYQPPDISKPCYVRVNTLKSDVNSALLEFGKQFTVQKDDMVPDLLILPPHADLHNHPLILNGSVFVQGKASSMVAAALDPKPGWEVLDACSAPGNKTVHLASLMKGKGRIIAFLQIRAILLDPSCSGSGTAAQRLDHLLPSHAADVPEAERLNKLAAFQKKALAHALSFPAVERVVYSTCSIYQTENEDVVMSVSPLAASHGFVLVTPFPQWHRRGIPVFEGSAHLLRTDPVEDKEGFFIALFVKNGNVNDSEELSGSREVAGTLSTKRRHFKRLSHVRRNKRLLPVLYSSVSKILYPPHILPRRRICRT
ncbi:28S rRNA (cytosine-C(5))-methyltransferase isoform X4 [Jatropha curcas]|uniref:28S rRNA (cytosine-C(5))-methyltransferase isoform X4 n=1 Tax=Jatropha curcas TaxID=180498 RepID=UPI001894DE01|nr:28S rRNA (cytosine-C(5))-methyltransferase isoform X4 [Jatropha curcas]